MGDKARNDAYSVRKKLMMHYKINDAEKGEFFLKVDWLLENAVYPKENGYADNLIELWNLYMPEYPFDRIVLEYSKKYFSVLRFVHDNNISEFNNVKYMQEIAVKNYIKSMISQGTIDRMLLMRDCFDAFKEIVDRTKLYDFINQILEGYSIKNTVDQMCVVFIRRFQGYEEQPYTEIIARLENVNEQKSEEAGARSIFYHSLYTEMAEDKFQTLFNILLCKIAVSDGERRFSDTLEENWNALMEGIPYHEKIYTFIDKYEKPYMNAACFGIENIRDIKIIRQLYKDSIILSAFLKSLQDDSEFGLKEVNDFWKLEGMHFANGYYFDEEYERMRAGFNKEILLAFKDYIQSFHTLLIQRIEREDFSRKSARNEARSRRAVSLEMKNVALNEKDRQIKDLQEKVTELEEKVEVTERDVLSQFISLLDSKKYGHVLGKLYRTAYTEDMIKSEDIKVILKNLFEIMNINGIDIYGELDAKVSKEDIISGQYRVDERIRGKAIVKYPGYKLGNAVILHPIAEEV